MPILDTYTLIDSVEISEADGNVRRYTEVNIMRKLKGKDMRSEAFARILSGTITGDDMLDLAKRLCDVPAHVIDEMTTDDIMGLFGRLEPFLAPKGSKAPKK